MSELQAKDLLQAKVLGCLDPEEENIFSKLLEEDKDFPWQEYGRYQNIVSKLPILLDAEIPDQDVKNKIATKLLELNKLNQVEEASLETSNDSEEEDDTSPEIETSSDIVIETTDVDPEISPEEISTVKPEKKKIMFREHGVLQNALEDKVNAKTESRVDNQNYEDKKTQSSSPQREVNRKNIKSHISKSPVYIEPQHKEESKKGTIISIILFIVAMIAIIVVYFKLSSDIRDNKNEIESLKEQLSSIISVDFQITDPGSV